MGSRDESFAQLVRALAHAPDAGVASVPVVVVKDGALRIEVDELAAHPPAQIGGFTVTGVIGAGGMGVIFEGVDPTLKRRVAIKLLQARRSTPEGSARLLREAQALAQLAHPNVVVVYHAGTEGDRVYLVMERVTGANARVWRDAAPRTVAEIVEVYRQAAAGLAVAHRAGLVHRDVKPENILVGDDGRVRVTDFGLVAGLDAEPERGVAQVELDEATGTLTQTGTILGTLPYIAPEAHDGRGLTARADQWSLCVALWEAIAGERPHAGETALETIAAVRGGALTRGTAKVPPAIRAALERGLALDPAVRWPSLDALFAAFATRPPRRRVPRTALVGGATLALGGVAVVAGLRLARHAPAPPVPVRLSAPGGCPYSPVYVGDALVYDDGNGDVWTLGGGKKIVATPGNDWRANRGRRPGEAVYVTATGGAYVDVATGKVEPIAIESASFAVGGGMLFYDRTDVPEVRRVKDGDDQRAVALPDGRWPYTVAASADGRRLAITTALDRSSPTLCLAELDDRGVARAAPTCLTRGDIIVGRAAFSPDGRTLYYQTNAGIRRRRDDDDDVLWLPDVFPYGGIDVAADGQTLTYSDSHPIETELAPVEPAGPPVVRGPAGTITPLPDGGWLYVRHLEGKLDAIVAQTRAGTRVLSSDLGRVMLGPVDPTAKRGVFDLDGAEPGIHIIDLKPYPPVRLTTTAADSNPIFTADGKVAFTRWDANGQPAVIVIDPAEGVRGDAGRKPANPLPRVTATLLPTTGELILLGLDGHSLFAWDPVTGRERPIDLRGFTRTILQIAAAPDGTRLALLDDDSTVWVLPLDGAGSAYVAKQPPACGTSDRPEFDATGHLFVVTRPWRGDLYGVALDP